MARFTKSFVREQEGASMLEYGVLLALIAAVCMTAISFLGNQIYNAFNTVSGTLS